METSSLKKPGAGPSKSKFKLSDVIKFGAGMTRGTGQPVRKAYVDKDGRITLEMGIPAAEPADGPKGEQNEWDTLIKDSEKAGD